MADNYNEVIWLIGDGRSGTTWVSNLINHANQYREMFEPFHPMFIPEVNFVLPHQYFRPHDIPTKFTSILSDILTGKFTHERVDCASTSTRPEKLLVKDIFVNLLSYAASLQFPDVKIILLIRNPFAMALSKYKKINWCWVTEPLHLLNQAHLYEDYLHGFEDIIRQTSAKKNYILNQVLIWAIINYIPLLQFKPDNIHICFFENIYTEPTAEISKLFTFTRNTNDYSQVDLDENIIKKPSRILGSDVNLLSGKSPITAWQTELPPDIIEDGLKILEHFNFNDLYDENSMPKRSIIKSIQNK